MNNATDFQSLRVAVLLSGRGSNFQALFQSCDQNQIQFAVVVSNRPQAHGLAWATDQGLQTATFATHQYENRVSRDQAMADFIQQQGVQWVVLAGYDQIITTDFIQAFAGRILNIHPSLLPAYGGKGMVGMAVHQAVVDNQETQSGCTVHGVIEGVDEGPILGRSVVPVQPTDTPEDVAQRVLSQEHQLYPAVLNQLALLAQQSPDCNLEGLLAKHPAPWVYWQSEEVASATSPSVCSS